MAAAMALDDGLAAAAFPSSPCAAAAPRPMQDGPAWSTMSATQSAVSCSPTIGPDGESSIFPVPWVPERATVHCREPLVYTIDDFLSAREAEHFRTLAAPRLRRATVAADSHSDERRSFSENRTNRVTWLQRPDDTLRAVEQRVCDLFQVPVDHSEHFQVIHYAPGQEYRPHMDTYELGECAMAGADGDGGDDHEPIDIPGGQRTMSVLLYLNDVPPEAGGATIFPRLRRRPPDGAPPPPQLDYQQQAGAPLSIAPAQGRLLAFATCLPGTNTPDPRTLHAGAPLRPLPSAGVGVGVGGGGGAEKWAVNKWLRERRIRPDWGREGEGVHLGMGEAELGELLGEMSEEELRQALHEEGCGGGEGEGGGGEDDRSTHSAAAWPVSGGGAVASAEAMRGALRRHFGLPAAGGDGGGAGGADAACSSSMAGR